MDQNTLLMVLAIYATTNAIVFIVYGYDKRCAQNNVWRIPKSTLLVISFLGPFGAFGAMRLFRHKTQKILFYLVPLFVILHLILIVWLIVTL